MKLSIWDRIHAWWTRAEGHCDYGHGGYRVKYPDGKISAIMPFGNAVDYVEMFGGEAIQMQRRG